MNRTREQLYGNLSHCNAFSESNAVEKYILFLLFGFLYRPEIWHGAQKVMTSLKSSVKADR
jgi:hypothetical protein